MTKQTTYTLLLAAYLFLILTLPQAKAATNPAPQPIIAAAHQAEPPPPHTTRKRAWIICRVFKNCTPALNVAYCESRIRTDARNGQYKGMFQLGQSERRIYGHGPSAWTQAKAAYNYYQIAGWLPWACKP